MDNAFRDRVLKTTGTDIDKILPPVSRFGGGREVKKQTVIEKLQTFFEKYFGLGATGNLSDEEPIVYQYQPSQPELLMVAEDKAEYNAKQGEDNKDE